MVEFSLQTAFAHGIEVGVQHGIDLGGDALLAGLGEA